MKIDNDPNRPPEPAPAYDSNGEKLNTTEVVCDFPLLSLHLVQRHEADLKCAESQESSDPL